ncbi:MAG: glutamate racemase, partial [Candidatus Gallimonas sp.]
MRKNEIPTVGLFDSGIGGLTVLVSCVRAFPDARFLYYGDNGRAPYGNRSEREISEFVRQGVGKLLRAGAQTVILACNTATAVCAETLRAELSVPVIGTEPAVAPAARVCRNALVLATPRTIASSRLLALTERYPSCRFLCRACPDLAGEIERCGGRADLLDLSRLLPAVACDGVVLGCTHYVWIREAISRFYAAPVFDGNEGVARRLRAVLESQGYAPAPPSAVENS